MIQPPRNIVEVTSNGMPLEIIPLGVKKSGIRHLRDIVSNRIYSDKILAPIREYSTNAADAHAAKGISDRPILITLPNTLNPMFEVRDYGHGMSEFQISDTFANYGESTKRNTNEQVGMFGIGSKSAFAYGVVSFMVVSYQAGVKNTYMVSTIGGPDDDGGIFPIGKEPTTEEDGVLIQVPVKSDDISRFVSSASKFFKHWTVMPIFQGNAVTIKPIEKQFAGSDWYMANTDSSDSNYAHILMGNITYRIDFSGLGIEYGEAGDYYIIKALVNEAALTISLPIGSVDFAASREILEYTVRTKSVVASKLRRISDELSSLIKSKVEEIPTTFGRYCYANKLLTFDSPFYKIWQYLKNKVNLPTHYDLDAAGESVSVESYSRSHKGNRRFKSNRSDRYRADKIECRETICYVLNDVTKNIDHHVVPLGERENNALGKKYNKVLVFTIADKVVFDKWAADHNFDIPLVLASTLPAVKPKELYPNSYSINQVSSNKNPLNGSKLLVFKPNGGRVGTNHGYFSVEPIVTPIDGSRIPYIEIDYYQVRYYGEHCYSGFCEPSKFAEGLNAISKVVGDVFPTIVAVKTSKISKLDTAKYIPFSEWFIETFNKNTVYSDKMAACNFHIDKAFDSETCRLVIRKLKETCYRDMVTRSETKQLLASCEGFFSGSTSYIYEIEQFQKKFVRGSPIYLETARNREIGGLKQTTEFFERYPILNMLSDSVITYQSDSSNAKLVQYINFVDSQSLTVDKNTVSV